MLDLLFLLLLGAILLFIFSAQVRQWVLMRFLLSVQRRMQQAAEEQQRAEGRSTSGQSAYTGQGATGGEARAPQGKLDMDDIVTKKFDTPRSEDYVDFEELPK